MKHQWFLGACLALGLGAVTAHAQAPATPTTPPSIPPTVQAATAGSFLKIDGRMFVGIFDTEKDGAYPFRALTIPDAKLRFTFNPSKNITIVNRFSNKQAKNDNFDYFYMDLKDVGPLQPDQVLRLGKIKIDFGEETWIDNPVENILITASAAGVGGYDGGINLRGKLPVSRPSIYSLAVLNGTGSVGDSTRGLPIVAKVGGSPVDNLFISGSIYQSGDQILPNGNVTAPSLKVAGLQSVPTGATGWKRNAWEVDARWNFGPNGIKPEIPSSGAQPPFQAAVAYGHFKDDFTGVDDRSGNYWYVEGLYNATSKVYVASRLSQVKLADDATAKLVDSPVAVNKYQRLSLGAGYHLTPLTDLKAEYSVNNTKGGASEPKLNQIAVGIATKF